ncbi:TIM barrel protein [Isoptericola sp. b441]|uniref:TIM barrel protein n=1 Tax=Actinotalea lenta TaxID=3064654 RepID=A0ABT9DEL0_9CELL|nr:TIM barrel protein [Isoptericola sp. b441]MDO8107996.1 TIM barrel protein [Isoptericola sp. b441]
MWTLAAVADEIDPDPWTQLAVLRDLGIGHLDLRTAWRRRATDLTHGDLDRLAEVLEAHEARVATVHAQTTPVDLEDARTAVGQVERAIAAAQGLGARWIRIFPFATGGGHEAVRADVVARTSELAKLAEHAGMTLLVTNHPGSWGATASAMAELEADVGSAALRVALDPGGYLRAGVRPFPDAYGDLRARTACLQVTDFSLELRESVPAGTGDARIRETVAALSADGYDGLVVIEPHLTAHDQLGGRVGADNVVRAVQALTEILEDQGIPFV